MPPACSFPNLYIILPQICEQFKFLCLHAYSCICCIYAPESRQYRTSFRLGNPSDPDQPCMQFLLVRPRLCPRVSILPASGFLQIPPRDGHRICLQIRLRLTVPAAGSAEDFHRQVIAHAERTRPNNSGAAVRSPGIIQSSGIYSEYPLPRTPSVTGTK